MNKKIGFIGCGNMGEAILGGILSSGILKSDNIWVSELSKTRLDELSEKYGVNTTTDGKEVVKNSDIFIIAVKPNIYPAVLEDIKELVDSTKTVVTIAAGVTIASVENIIGSDKRIIRTMPNTPALVGEGMTSISPNGMVSIEELEEIKIIFGSFGKSEILSEYLIDSVIGVSGSSPAYVFMFIEALADGAVLQGMPRDKAYKFAAQSVLGSAKMVLETGKHPGVLKDAVCSPGGTTIEAVKVLEEEGFRKAVIKAVEACAEKSKKMSK
ncbi:pyrroline-5-carboxylate reductase [uncultured Ilyobacter sp.]|uniref:pyrroline-5-carboxylate reductase n=1 Tax=uncultured Ilyobacter sp. TaxID=544433 RepID=UPI0029F4EBDA|nr:pyrroline-5-carboxylate reductase [uncultured Ilyobacter sp.]